MKMNDEEIEIKAKIADLDAKISKLKNKRYHLYEELACKNFTKINSETYFCDLCKKWDSSVEFLKKIDSDEENNDLFFIGVFLDEVDGYSISYVRYNIEAIAQSFQVCSKEEYDNAFQKAINDLQK